MLEFVVHNWKLEPHPAMLLIPELKQVLDFEKKTAEGRSQGLKNLLFVWGQVSKASPFDDLAPTTRELQVRRCVYGASTEGPTREDKVWPLLDCARAAYLYHNDTSEDRLMHELSYMVDTITDFLRSVREAGITDAKQLGPILTSMASIKSLLINKREAEKVLKDGLEKTKTKNRANAEPSPLERGMLNEVLKRSQRSAAETLATQEAESE